MKNLHTKVKPCEEQHYLTFTIVFSETAEMYFFFYPSGHAAQGVGASMEHSLPVRQLTENVQST